MLKGAIFDFDGTLFDSMFIWDTAGEVYLQSIGIKSKENLKKVLKTMSLLQSAEYMREKYSIPLTIEEIMAGINQIVEDFYFYMIQPKKGVIELLEQMKTQGIKMCIATATDRYQLESALKRCGMQDFFTEIFTCTEVGYGKDEPVIFQKAMEHMQTTKADTVVIEDAYYAVRTAKAAGFITITVYDSHEEKQRELRCISDCFLEDFTQTEYFWNFVQSI